MALGFAEHLICAVQGVPPPHSWSVLVARAKGGISLALLLLPAMAPIVRGRGQLAYPVA